MAEKLNYKIVLLGDSAVGKSSIMTRFIDNYFRSESGGTIALDFRIKQLQKLNKIVKLQIWDTAGQQLFRTISPSYYKNANAIVIVFDLMNKKSLQNIQSYWIEQIKKHCLIQPEIIILGNKQDSQVVKVDTECLSKLQENYKVPCLQVSAKTGNGVMEAFQLLINKCLEKTKSRLVLKSGINSVGVKKPSGFAGKINKNKKKKQRCY